MKILLVNPSAKAASDSPPVGIAILASILELEGYDVKIIDRAAGHDFIKEFNSFYPDVVGVTGTTQAAPETYACADYSKKKGCFTIIGGIHASIMPEEAMKYADCVVIGEGEIVLSSIIKNKTRGIVSGKPVIDLNSLPLPAYHLLDMAYYTSLLQRSFMNFASIAPSWFKLGTILSSRGCTHNCFFCYNSFRTLPIRFRSAEKVIEEMKFLIDTYEVGAIFFVEDNFFFHKKRTMKICELIKQEKIDVIWGGNSRVDCIDKEVLEYSKKNGCKQVTFGWESGSQRILDLFEKKVTVAQNDESIKLCNEVGLNASGTVMIGNPTETIDEINMTESFLKRNKITGGIGICTTTPYPGSKMWQWCIDNNRIPSNWNINRYSELDFHHLPIKLTDIPDNILLAKINELVNYAINTFRLMENERWSR